MCLLSFSLAYEFLLCSPFTYGFIQVQEGACSQRSQAILLSNLHGPLHVAYLDVSGDVLSAGEHSPKIPL